MNEWMNEQFRGNNHDDRGLEKEVVQFSVLELSRVSTTEKNLLLHRRERNKQILDLLEIFPKEKLTKILYAWIKKNSIIAVKGIIL